MDITQSNSNQKESENESYNTITTPNELSLNQISGTPTHSTTNSTIDK
ncbi:10445_t:CDS:1, partial [Acaulospora colombiana]